MNGLMRSELRKVLTTRLWWGLLLGLVVTWAGMTLLISVVAGMTSQGAAFPSLDDEGMVRYTYAAGLTIAYVISLAFGVMTMTGEYRYQTITATLLAAPRRSRVVLAKLGAVTVTGIGYGAIGTTVGIVVGAPVIALRGYSTQLAEPATWRAAALSTLAVALWAVLGLGVGTLLRNQVVALAVAVGSAWIVDSLLALLIRAAGLGSVARFLPGQATAAVIDPRAAASAGSADPVELLPWWGGALVLLGYAALSGMLGTVLTLRRDVT